MPKLLHASIPARDPAMAARALASIMGGKALPFPPGGPDAWMAWASDGQLEIEVVRRGKLLHFGEAETQWREGATPGEASECHLALSVDISAAEVIEIARSAGWEACSCVRGGFFELVEVWIDNAFLIEVFDPAQARFFEAEVNQAAWERLLEAA